MHSIRAVADQVICTTTILHDIVKNLVPSPHQVVCLLPVGSDPHLYDPTPADAARLERSDVIIRNGLYLEGWLNELIQTSGKNKPILTAFETIQPIQNEGLHAAPDPHAWMDPLLVMEMVQHLGEKFKLLWPNQTKEIENLNNDYIQKLKALHEENIQKLSCIPPESRVLVTSHDAFRYFGNRYGFRVESVMGISSDADVQTSDVAHLLRIIRATGIRAIFVETTINPKLMQQIAKDAGVRIGGSLYADSIGDSTSTASTYIDMVRHNVECIWQALGTTAPIEPHHATANPWLIVVPILFLLILSWVLLYRYVSKLKLKSTHWDHYTIEVNNLNVSYERKTVLANINFVLESGKLYGLLGPNGAGKSTLFKTILGFITPDTGTVRINGMEVEQVRNKIAYIPQKEHIDWSFPATVFEIVITGRLPHKSKLVGYNAHDKAKAMEAIAAMGLENFKNHQIGDLSGGQQQRVFIARALCQDAEVLFFDEPFVGVDVHTEQKIMQSIKRLKEFNKTIIIIHHDLSKVKEYFDQVIMVNQVLVALGPVETTFTPENIQRTYSGKSAILYQTDQYIHSEMI